MESEQSETLFAEYYYDANGNTVQRSLHAGSEVQTTLFSYDELNRLTESEEGGDVTTYRYDNAGNRFLKEESDGAVTLYLRHGQIAVAMDIEIPDDTSEIHGKLNRYVLSGDLVTGRVSTAINADATQDVTKSWYNLDHLNSTKVVTDETGAVEVRYVYRAFGEQLARLDALGTATDDSGKYSYGGKELDGDTNLYYFNARYYDATLGRFINVDPVQDGTNWYVYCSNNPLSFVDPTGLEKDYTIDYEQYNHQDFQIDYYYDNAKEPITVTFDGETHTVGEDLDFDDSVPFDAEFNVPDGSLLEIKSGSTTFSMAGAGRVNLPKSINRYNAIVSSEAFKRAVKKDRLIGVGETAAGVLLMGGSIWLASTLAPETGGAAAMDPAKGFTMGAGLFAFGLSIALGNNNQSAIDDFLFTATPPEAAFTEFGKLR
ncbi:RHS repeat-associated core domain-containing protein [Marispirochaeta aestuarii]|uniref:RHS repeat domain-containing protein n=1 Tax=Marispirochaeta aestuarii TaxID=1963862 RepID=UPI0029C7AA45|nr:RHS repeat-associated core domain-containing protein [Marispirochaeta aestuarii]